MNIINNSASAAAKNRAVFFDRDGVINEMVERGDDFFVHGKKIERSAPYYFSEFKMYPGVEEFLANLEPHGFLRVLATNQPDITYGTMPPEEHEKIMEVVNTLPFDALYLCLHGRNDGCECKKPLPGMLHNAASDHNIDLASSYMVGDSSADVKAGQAAGCKTILVDRPYNQEVEADYRVRDLNEIFGIIT